ncbi:T9SS type A sorting domain-containing protein [Cryomorphaceae bacterium 1068]|nr:T9SS type A sorting domain-containing protein [Cryomorphaceae bacterium 1068]
MKNYLYLSSILVLVSASLFGQIDQGTFHRGMSNYYTDVLLYPDSSFILSESIQENGARRAALTAKSPFGVNHWEIITEEEIEVLVFNELIPIDDSNFGVLGYRQDCCDCSAPIAFYQVRSLEDGSLINEVNEILPEGALNTAFTNEDFDVALTSWGFVAANFNGDAKTVYNFNLQGDLLGSYTLPAGGDRVTGFIGDYVMEQQNNVYRYDQLGNELDSILLEDGVVQLAASANTLATLDNQFLRFYDDDFELMSSISHSGDEFAIFSSPNGFHFYEDGTMYRMNEVGEIEMSTPLQLLPGLQFRGFSGNDDFFILSGEKGLIVPNFIFPVWHLHAAWQMHGVEGPAPLWHVDLGLTDISIDALEIENQIGNTPFEATVTVTVENDGTFPSSEYHLNYVQSDGICFDFYGKQLIETSVPNQDEVSITLVNITGVGPPLQGDSVQLNICIFLTSPLGTVDVVNSNDLICINEIFYLSTDDIDLSQYIKIYPNPAQNILRIDSELAYSEIRLFNSLGQIVETKIFNGQGHLDISHLIPGFYLLKIETEQGQVTKKIVID